MPKHTGSISAWMMLSSYAGYTHSENEIQFAFVNVAFVITIKLKDSGLVLWISFQRQETHHSWTPVSRPPLAKHIQLQPQPNVTEVDRVWYMVRCVATQMPELTRTKTKEHLFKTSVQTKKSTNKRTKHVIAVCTLTKLFLDFFLWIFSLSYFASHQFLSFFVFIFLNSL